MLIVRHDDDDDDDDDDCGLNYQPHFLIMH